MRLVGINDHTVARVHGERIWFQVDSIRHIRYGYVFGDGERFESSDM